jgi:hypothetical protein
LSRKLLEFQILAFFIAKNFPKKNCLSKDIVQKNWNFTLACSELESTIPCPGSCWIWRFLLAFAENFLKAKPLSQWPPRC